MTTDFDARYRYDDAIPYRRSHDSVFKGSELVAVARHAAEAKVIVDKLNFCRGWTLEALLTARIVGREE